MNNFVVDALVAKVRHIANHLQATNEIRQALDELEELLPQIKDMVKDKKK